MMVEGEVDKKYKYPAGTKLLEDDEGNIKSHDEIRRDYVKDELKSIIGIDKLDQEHIIGELADKYNIKIGALRKQLLSFEKQREKELKESEPDEEEEELVIQIKEYTDDEIKEAKEKFNDTNLLENIKIELDKKHLGDDNAKMTIFLTELSGLIPMQKLRSACKIGGASAAGKDNAMRTTLLCMPRESHLFVTSATAATLQDDIKHVNIVAFSELNLFREGGANKHNLETIKQITEGGASSLKKDKRTDNKTVRFEQDEQKSVIFGTTDIQDDEELGTRILNVPISVTEEKIAAVNQNTLDLFSDPDKMLNNNDELDNWIRIGLSTFYRNEEKYNVFIPYAKLLKKKLNGVDIFDNRNPRSQRDLKRVLNLTCAMTYLFQQQREIIEIEDTKFLVSDPIDFINVLKIAGEFFDQTYMGMDVRVLEVMKTIEKFHFETGNKWVSRDLIQKEMGKTRNTIKTYCGFLSGLGLIEGCKGSAIENTGGCQFYDLNKIYYKKIKEKVSKEGVKKVSKGVSEGVKKVSKGLISVDISDLEDYLISRNEQYRGSRAIIHSPLCFFSVKGDGKLTPLPISTGNVGQIDTLLTPSNTPFDTLLTPLKQQNDTNITPLGTTTISTGEFTTKELEQAGLTQEDLE